MKKYDKIYVPSKNNDSEFSLATQHGTAIVSKLDQHTNSIVVSIEELRELWDTALQKGWEESRPTDDEDLAMEFSNYLKSKGIDPTK